MLRVADEVHIEYAIRVQLVDDVPGRNANGGDEQLGATGDDDVDELVEFALGVVPLQCGSVLESSNRKWV